MDKEDKRLGMDRDISRRDFLEGSLQFAGGVGLASVIPGEIRADSQAGMVRQG